MAQHSVHAAVTAGYLLSDLLPHLHRLPPTHQQQQQSRDSVVLANIQVCCWCLEADQC